ncbi:unnamed protein product [Paramecium sonneborni]|uniref:Uncharacterized protein n=1 Tax=Paramecium sonneborni TaxID=65129 RepID=A0A8S1MFJ2_9CILI|nr:unnamed protein product [Paramecium sonneborni]
MKFFQKLVMKLFYYLKVMFLSRIQLDLLLQFIKQKEIKIEEQLDEQQQKQILIIDDIHYDIHVPYMMI